MHADVNQVAQTLTLVALQDRSSSYMYVNTAALGAGDLRIVSLEILYNHISYAHRQRGVSSSWKIDT
jgi:hypothetical protein